MLRWLRRILIVAVMAGLLVGVGVAANYWWKQNAAPKYLTAALSRGRVETVVNSTGTVKPVRTVSVGAFVSGPIAEVLVDYNSEVREKQVLARIDKKLLKAAYDRDQAALEAQQADQKRVEALALQAKNNYERARKLQAVNKDYLSDTEMDQYKFASLTADAQVTLSKAAVKQAEAQVNNSAENLEYANITAPEDGVVIERKVDKGQTVAASFQTPELFTIGVEMKQHMYVYASVDEADVGLIREAKDKGRPVSFTVDAYPGELFEGVIEPKTGIRYNSTTTQNVVTYPVIIVAPNPDMKLMPGMTANLSFQIEAKEDVVRLPAAALRFVPTAAQVRPEDRHYLEGARPADAPAAVKGTAANKAEKAKNLHNRHVWVRDGDLLRAVPVVLGLIDYQYAEILSGDLVEGQTVVTGTDTLFGPR